MSHLAQVPLWAAILVSLLVALGSGLTLLGTLGLVRLSSFQDRIHAPTLGTSWGTLGIMLASALLFSVTGARLVVHELIIGVLVITTTPATMMILARAALFRGAQSGAGSAPDKIGKAAAASDGSDQPDIPETKPQRSASPPRMPGALRDL